MCHTSTDGTVSESMLRKRVHVWKWFVEKLRHNAILPSTSHILIIITHWSAYPQAIELVRAYLQSSCLRVSGRMNWMENGKSWHLHNLFIDNMKNGITSNTFVASISCSFHASLKMSRWNGADGDYCGASSLGRLNNLIIFREMGKLTYWESVRCTRSETCEALRADAKCTRHVFFRATRWAWNIRRSAWRVAFEIFLLKSLDFALGMLISRTFIFWRYFSTPLFTIAFRARKMTRIVTRGIFPVYQLNFILRLSAITVIGECLKSDEEFFLCQRRGKTDRLF